MRAHIVNKITIDRIVNLVMDGKEVVQYNISPFPILDEDLQKFGQQLWDMNARAVNQRYGENTPAPVYRLAGAITEKVQMLKSLQCFLYQCSEGDVPQMELYQQLRRVEKNLAFEIIRDLPAYQKAEWG